VLFHRVHRILRTGGLKTAACQRAENHSQCGRDHSLIDAHTQDQNSLDRVHGLVSLAAISSFALLSVVKKSCSTSENLLPAIDGRATSTISTFRLRSCWWSLKHSRSRRLARFRTTAHPILPAVITPKRDRLASGSDCQLIIRQPTTIRCPCWRNRWKSRPCLMRSARLNLRRREACAAISARIIRESTVCGRPGGD